VSITAIEAKGIKRHQNLIARPVNGSGVICGTEIFLFKIIFLSLHVCDHWKTAAESTSASGIGAWE
jgi:hypothetical protein